MAHFHEAQTPEDMPAEMQGEPIAQDEPIAARVWLVFVEENKAAEPCIIGVYATEALAEAARAQQIDEEHSYGHVVWAVDTDEGEWDVDVHIEAFEVQS